MKPIFNERRYARLLRILAQGGFVNEYIGLCREYNQKNYDDERPKLDFDRTVDLFKARDPSVKALKKWRMLEFGTENVREWVWTGSLVIKRYDGLELMLKGVSEDGTETVGAGWMNLADGARKLLPESIRPSHANFSHPHYDGSALTMERMVADIYELFRHTKTLIRQGWSNEDEADAPESDDVDQHTYAK